MAGWRVKRKMRFENGEKQKGRKVVAEKVIINLFVEDEREAGSQV